MSASVNLIKKQIKRMLQEQEEHLAAQKDLHQQYSEVFHGSDHCPSEENVQTLKEFLAFVNIKPQITKKEMRKWLNKKIKKYSRKTNNASINMEMNLLDQLSKFNKRINILLGFNCIKNIVIGIRYFPHFINE